MIQMVIDPTERDSFERTPFKFDGKNRGKEQAMYISPMRDAIDAGLRPTDHTDFVVAPLDQMMMLYSAVNRISRGGAEIGLDQRVTPYEGLKCMTMAMNLNSSAKDQSSRTSALKRNL